MAKSRLASCAVSDAFWARIAPLIRRDPCDNGPHVSGKTPEVERPARGVRGHVKRVADGLSMEVVAVRTVWQCGRYSKAFLEWEA